jgi:hypothetical protein
VLRSSARLEALAVAAIDGELGVHVEAFEDGDRLGLPGSERIDDAQGWLSRALSEQVDSASGGTVAAGQGGMLELERIGQRVQDKGAFVAIADLDAVEGQAV